MPQGVLAGLHVVTSADRLQGAEYAFEVLAGQPSEGTLNVWAEFTEPGPSKSVPVMAHLASGGGGRDRGVDVRTYRLWFPVGVASLESDLAFWIRWDDAGIVAGPLSIGSVPLELASRSAISV